MLSISEIVAKAEKMFDLFNDHCLGVSKGAVHSFLCRSHQCLHGFLANLILEYIVLQRISVGDNTPGDAVQDVGGIGIPFSLPRTNAEPERPIQYMVAVLIIYAGQCRYRAYCPGKRTR